MEKNKGGRGKKNPYETTHLRVPVPIKDVLVAMIDDYRITGDVPDMDDKSRASNGQFVCKGNSPRKVRTVRLSDECWAYINECAHEQGLSLGDYIENLYQAKKLDQRQQSVEKNSLSKLFERLKNGIS